MNINRVNLLLIGFSVSVLTIAVGLILGQNVKNLKNSAIKEDYQRKMIDLPINNNLQQYGVEIITSKDSQFDAELSKYIGGNEDLISLVNSAKPFAFFVKNNSSKEIVGISLQWIFIDSNGKKNEFPQSEANPGVLMGIKPLDPKMKSRTSLINIDDKKFFSYFNDSIGHKIAFANMRNNNPTVNFKALDEITQSDVFNLNYQKEKILNNYTDFSVSIDGVIFADGTFVGANKNSFFDVLSGQIQARRDILTNLAESKLSGEEDKDILDSILSKTSNISAHLTELRSKSATPEQAFDYSYRVYLKNLKEELIMKRSKMSDKHIIEQFQSVKLSDLIILRKIEDSTK